MGTSAFALRMRERAIAPNDMLISDCLESDGCVFTDFNCSFIDTYWLALALARELAGYLIPQDPGYPMIKFVALDNRWCSTLPAQVARREGLLDGFAALVTAISCLRLH
jgi:hypothetical protein